MIILKFYPDVQQLFPFDPGKVFVRPSVCRFRNSFGPGLCRFRLARFPRKHVPGSDRGSGPDGQLVRMSAEERAAEHGSDCGVGQSEGRR